MADHRTTALLPGPAFDRFRAKLLADRGLSLVADEEEPGAASKVLRDGDAALMLSFADGLLTTRWCGPVSGGFLAKGQAWGEDAQGCSAAAVVADFTAARILFTGEHLESVMSASQIKRASRPRALLYQPKHSGLFKGYALRSAHMGVLQRGFFDRTLAEAWARDAAARYRG